MASPLKPSDLRGAPSARGAFLASARIVRGMERQRRAMRRRHPWYAALAAELRAVRYAIIVAALNAEAEKVRK